MEELTITKLDREDMTETREALELVYRSMSDEDRNTSMLVPFLKSAIEAGEEEADLDNPEEAELLNLCKILLKPLTPDTIDEVIDKVVELTTIYADKARSTEESEEPDD